MTETLDAPHPAAVSARAFLEAAGVRGITIEGAEERWRVSVGWNEHERFVVAFSEKNPNTPNDPLYLAGEALAALIRNEGPCPFHAPAQNDEQIVDSCETQPDAPVEELWSPAPPQEPEDSLGAELLADEIAESHALETGDAAVTAAGEGVESEPSPVQAYPGIAVLEDELGRRRNQVRTWIRDVEKARKRAHSDTSRRTFLAQAYADYQNIVIPNRRPPTEIEQGYADDYLNMLRADEEIERWSTALDDAAEHADMDRLAAIAADLGYAPGS